MTAAPTAPFYSVDDFDAARYGDTVTWPDPDQPDRLRRGRVLAALVRIRKLVVRELGPKGLIVTLSPPVRVRRVLPMVGGAGR